MWRTEGRSGGRKLTQKAVVVSIAGAMGRQREEVDTLQVDLVELGVLLTKTFSEPRLLSMFKPKC